jgi:antirestriction protein ArdC
VNQTKSKTPCPCREAGEKKGAEKMNTYEIVTERIVDLPEHGVIPWRRPWASTGLPRNLVSKKTYRGVNSFLLGATRYVSPFWLTLKQANQLGGSVRKGEHGELVIFWKVEGLDDTVNIEGNETARRRLLLRFYRVWNLEQCALPQAVLDKLPTIEMHEHDPIEAAEKIVAGMPNRPPIRYEGSKAYYNSVTDQITLPPRELFTSAEEFYGTLDHELVHAAGAPKRLNRESIAEATPFGSPVYATEELNRGDGRGVSMRRGENLARRHSERGRVYSRLVGKTPGRQAAGCNSCSPGATGGRLYIAPA